MKKKGQSVELGVTAVVVILLLLGTVLVLMLGYDMVEPSHLGVKVRFGEIKGVMENGFRWTGLFTTVHKYDLRTRKVVIELIGDNSAVDKTGQYISSTINVNYRVRRDKETILSLYTNIGRDNVIADRLNIDAIIREGFKQATVKYDALEIIDKRQEVKELAKENIRSNFPSEYFEIENIVVTNIDFSQGFKKAIEDKKIAEQRALEEENKLQVVIFQQKQAIEKFKADAEKIKLQSQALTELTLRQKYLETWDGKLPIYMISNPETMSMFLPSPDLISGE